MADAPLFGTTVQTSPAFQPQDLKRRLAQAMLASAGDTSPVGSPWAALSRALSPLAGILATRSADKADAAISNDAAPIYAQLAHSDDPISIAAMSNNPLIRALLPQLAEKQIGAGFDLRNDAAKGRAAKELNLQYDPQTAAATNAANQKVDLEYKPQVAAATAGAEEKATFPYKQQLLKLQQALGYANLGEQKRHNQATEAGGAGNSGMPTLFGSNPASLYGGAQ